MIRFDGLILAGGRGRRLGGIDKPGLVVGDETLLQRAVRAVDSAEAVAVVGPQRPAQSNRSGRLIRTREDPPGAGPAAAIEAGLDALSAAGPPSELTIVLASDLPAAVPAVRALMADVVPSGAEADGWIAVDSDGRRQFLLAAYRTSALTHSCATLTRRRGSLAGASVRQLIEVLRLRRSRWNRGLLTDIDTPEASRPPGPTKGTSMTYPPQLDEWLQRVGPGLGTAADDVDIDAVLALAGRAAHEIARPAAPLTTYLVGLAVGRGMSFEQALEVVADHLASLVTEEFHTARALAHSLGANRPLGFETIVLHGAAGRVLAAPAVARTCVPAADISAMDGWAVSGQGPWMLDGAVVMGQPPGTLLASGTARSITTGGALPQGATAVLRLEHGRSADGTIWTADAAATPALFADVRRMGEEVHEGEVVAPPGARITPAVLAAAAVAGIVDVVVRRRARVALAVLGDEVVAEGLPGPGRVGDAFGASLPAILADLGAEVVRVDHIGDELGIVQTCFAQGDIDLVISTGGTGHGQGDHVAEALGRLGCTIAARGVAMRPGHPVILAARPDRVPVLALPGNPFAALVAMITLGVPMTAGLSGSSLPSLQRRVAGAWMAGAPSGVRLVAVRETMDGVIPVPKQRAAMACSLVSADAIAVVGATGIESGSACDVLRVPW